MTNSGPDETADSKAKKYARTHQILSVAETVIFYAFILILVFTGLSKQVETIAYSFTENNYVALLIFFGVIGIAELLITFPLDFYSGFILEHKYGLSNQTLSKYFIEKFKGIALGSVLSIILMTGFYYTLTAFKENWWFVLGMLMFFFSVIAGRLAPTLIMPIFYKFKPIEDLLIKEKIQKLCENTGVKVKGIFTFNMSKNTKKANAAFTGLGKSKRIILGDTLMESFTPEEIETVFAHEVGHYKKRHIIKLMALSTILTFAGLYITSRLYESSLSQFGFSSITELAALPLLLLYLSLYALVTSPLSNILSRKFEWEADTFALTTTHNKPAFISAMQKLANQNLADKSPNKIIEFLFHSHPSIEKRIQFARNFSF